MSRLYDERRRIARLDDHRFAQDERENRITSRYLYDYDAQQFRATPLPVTDQASIANHGGVRIGINETGVKDCYYGNDDATMLDRWQRQLTLYNEAPRYVTWATNLDGLPEQNGNAIRFSHRKEGLGVTGETQTPGVLMHTTVNVQPYAVQHTAMLLRVDAVVDDSDLLSTEDGTDLLTTEDGTDQLALDLV